MCHKDAVEVGDILIEQVSLKSEEFLVMLDHFLTRADPVHLLLLKAFKERLDGIAGNHVKEQERHRERAPE